jgi:transposase
MKDCQWGSTLHAHGLLRGGFVPPAQIRQLQDYLRLRDDHIGLAGSHVQHMQKALERMNLKIHDVISNVVGASGLAVIKAILGGERNPERLLGVCDVQIQKRKAERMKEGVEGDVERGAPLCAEAGAGKLEHYRKQIAACDKQIHEVLLKMPASMTPPESPDGSGGEGARGESAPRKRAGINAPLHRGSGGTDEAFAWR